MTEGRTAAAALDALWESHRVGWRRLLSRAAWRELRLRADFDLDLLQPSAVISEIPIGAIPECRTCDDICCAGAENLVSLRLKDIATLIDIDRTDVIARKKPRFPEHLLESRPHLRDLSRSYLFRTLPVLRQEGPRRICAALDKNLKCTLHPHWPTSCERFPYSLNAIRRRIVWGTRCRSRAHRSDAGPRSLELREAAVAAYNERIRDAVLITHARAELDGIGLGAWLCAEDEDPFAAEPASRLAVLD